MNRILLILLVFSTIGCDNGQVNNSPRPKEQVKPPAPATHAVRVVGRKFQWIFQYPGPDGQFGELGHNPDPLAGTFSESLGLKEGGASEDDFFSPILILPIETPIEIQTISMDVRHELATSTGEISLEVLPWNTIFEISQFSRPSETMSEADQEKHRMQVIGNTGPPRDTFRFVYTPRVIHCSARCGKHIASQKSLLYFVEPDQYQEFLVEANNSIGISQPGLAGH